MRSDLWIRRGNYLHLVITAKQADGSDVSWAGYTATLVQPDDSGVGSVALNPAAVDAPGAGEITIDIDTKTEGADTRGPWSVTVTTAGKDTTLWQGRYIMELGEATRLRMEDGCGLDLNVDCQEPLVIYVPAQGIDGPPGPAANTRSGSVIPGAFSGDPMTAPVAFSTDLPDTNYAVTFGWDCLAEAQFNAHAKNRTVSGFDIELGSQDVTGLVTADWHATPHI